MGFIAPRLDVIKPSPSMAVTARAAEMRAAGIDVVSLSAGEPDFPTPKHVVDAAYAAMLKGDTRYTAVDGTAALKKAVAGKFKRENGLEFRPSEITVGGGAKQIIYNALMATLAHGDEVIVPAPYWVSYTDIVLLAEGRPVVVPCGQADAFKLTPAALRGAISDRAKWLLLNSPSNPTGAVYGKDELAELARVLIDYPNVHVMTDDIYEHILFDGRKFHTIAQVEPRLGDRTLTVNGVSKAYAMTGWRIGYAGGPEPLVRAIATLQSQSTSNPSSVSQAAAVAALDGPQEFLPQRALAFQERRDRAMDLLAGIPGLTCERPGGAFYLYPDCSGLIGRRTPEGKLLSDDGDVAAYLLDRARVAVVQGSAYGLSPHFRISIATSTELIEKAIGRIAEAVTALR